MKQTNNENLSIQPYNLIMAFKAPMGGKQLIRLTAHSNTRKHHLGISEAAIKSRILIFQALSGPFAPERASSFCIKISRNIDPACCCGGFLVACQLITTMLPYADSILAHRDAKKPSNHKQNANVKLFQGENAHPRAMQNYFKWAFSAKDAKTTSTGLGKRFAAEECTELETRKT